MNAHAPIVALRLVARGRMADLPDPLNTRAQWSHAIVPPYRANVSCRYPGALPAGLFG
jgi:hypothetical protein